MAKPETQWPVVSSGPVGLPASPWGLSALGFVPRVAEMGAWPRSLRDCYGPGLCPGPKEFSIKHRGSPPFLAHVFLFIRI